MNKELIEAKTILVVEDDADIGAVFLHLLVEETPYETLLVTDPFEALEVIKSIKPVLFILNYQLPHINGIDLYDRLHIQPHLTQVPAMMVSANLPKAELAQRGIVGLEKPLDINDFIDAVKQLVH